MKFDDFLIKYIFWHTLMKVDRCDYNWSKFEKKLTKFDQDSTKNQTVQWNKTDIHIKLMQKKQKSLWNECSWGQIKLNSSEILQKLKKKKKIAQHLFIFVLVLLNLIVDLIMIKRSRISANELPSERYWDKL